MTGNGVVHVCPRKDSICGDRPAGWCDECPLRRTLATNGTDEEIVTAVTSNRLMVHVRRNEYRLVIDASGAYRLQIGYELVDERGVHDVEWRDLPTVVETGHFV